MLKRHLRQFLHLSLPLYIFLPSFYILLPLPFLPMHLPNCLSCTSFISSPFCILSFLLNSCLPLNLFFCIPLFSFLSNVLLSFFLNNHLFIFYFLLPPLISPPAFSPFVFHSLCYQCPLLINGSFTSH